MKQIFRRLLLRAAVTAAGLLCAAPAWAQEEPPARKGSPAQQIAIPSYFAPGPLWEKMTAARAGVLAILNPDSGPGAAARADFAAQVKSARARGVTVLGYVRTGYGKRPFSEVESEVKQYYGWYAVSGIFFDEVSNDDPNLPYYVRCRAAARAADPKALVAVNPGTPVTEGYMNVADVVVTFEHDYGAYVKCAPDPAWVRRFPAKRFWHLIYAAPDEKAMREAVRLSKTRNAGRVYVTPDVLPNPWDTLPIEPYWFAELAALAAPKAP